MRKFKQSLYAYLLLILCYLFSTAGFAAQPKVVFLVPDLETNTFWREVSRFAQAAATDLNIDLTVVYSKGNSFSVRRDTLAIINAPQPPNYLISIYTGDLTAQYMEKAANKRIKYFLINSDIGKTEQQRIGLPRFRHKNWIGYMGPDDEGAGYAVADLLIREAQKQKLVDTEGRVNMVALEGPEDSNVANLRFRGLQRRLGSSNDAVLLQHHWSDWNESSALVTAQTLLTDHGNATVVWTVADMMALTSAKIVQSLGKVPGKDVLTAGVDWNTDALQAIAKGEITGSAGGHFMEAGWAMVLIHDYHNGIDFEEDIGTVIKTSMSIISSSNVNEYLTNFGDRDWDKIDFKKFSKFYNTKIDKYDFSLSVILQQLKK